MENERHTSADSLLAEVCSNQSGKLPMEDIDKRTNSAKLTINFANGESKTFEVAGEIYGDLETGAFKILSETGSKFVYIPNEERFTGKLKRRLKVLYNL